MLTKVKSDLYLKGYYECQSDNITIKVEEELPSNKFKDSEYVRAYLITNDTNDVIDEAIFEKSLFFTIVDGFTDGDANKLKELLFIED